jgi:hypothetical protein
MDEPPVVATRDGHDPRRRRGLVPSSWHVETLSLAAAPADSETSVLACRGTGPAFRPREVNRLAQLSQSAGRLLQTKSSGDNGADGVDTDPL